MDEKSLTLLLKRITIKSRFVTIHNQQICRCLTRKKIININKTLSIHYWKSCQVKCCKQYAFFWTNTSCIIFWTAPKYQLKKTCKGNPEILQPNVLKNLVFSRLCLHFPQKNFTDWQVHQTTRLQGLRTADVQLSTRFLPGRLTIQCEPLISDPYCFYKTRFYLEFNLSSKFIRK